MLQLITDTMVHTLNTDGSWNLNTVSEAYKNKMRKHDRAYNQQNIAFVPCVVTCYLPLSTDTSTTTLSVCSTSWL